MKQLNANQAKFFSCGERVNDLAVNGGLAAAAAGKKVFVFDEQNMSFLWRIDLSHLAQKVCFSEDGRRLVAVCSDATHVIDTASFNIIQVLQGHTIAPDGVAISRDGTLVVTASWDQTVRLWEIGGKKQVYEHWDPIDQNTGVAFLSGEKSIITGTHERALHIWKIPDVNTWAAQKSDDATLECVSSALVPRVHMMTLSSCKTRLASVHNTTITLHHVDDLDNNLWWVETPFKITAIASNPWFVARGTAYGITLMSMVTGEDLFQFPHLHRRTGSVTSLTFSSDGHLRPTIIAGYASGTVCAWPIPRV